MEFQDDSPPGGAGPRGRWYAPRTITRGCLVVLALWLAATLVIGTDGSGELATVERAWGWDETMHAELPAVQMLLHAQEGEWWRLSRVVHSCDRYPFLFPAVLGIWHGIFGLGQSAAQALGLLLHFLVALGVGRLAQQVARRDGEPSPRLWSGGWPRDAMLIGVVLALSSPLARRYAPTTFLEIPALVTIVWGLDAWIIRRRTEHHTVRGDLIAGMWLAAAFFTKFNYALLLFGAIGLDSIAELIRARASRSAWISFARVFAPLGIGLVWWFVLPYPFGADKAAAHRESFASFISGNTMHPMQAWLRATNWLTGVAAHSFLFVALVLCSVVFVLRRRTPIAWTLGLSLLAFTVPVVSHPFQLDRFLLPASLILWTLGAATAARWLDRSPRSFAFACASLLALCLSISTFQTTWWVGFPLAPVGTPGRDFQEAHVNVTLSMFGPPASNGLTRATHDSILDLIADELGESDTVGWLGQSAEMSPAALHLGLLARGGSARRFLDYAHGPMDIDPIPRDLKVVYETDELVAYARQFDRLIMMSTGDLKDRTSRSWIRHTWHRTLVRSDQFDVKELGTIFVRRPTRGPLPVVVRMATPRSE